MESAAKDTPTTSRGRLVTVLVYLVFGLLCFGETLFYSRVVGTGVMPDEIAHTSYVSYLVETGRLTPEFPEMRIFAPDGSWGQIPNYIAHPPLYYHLLRWTQPDNRSGFTREALIQRARFATPWMGLAAIVLMMWIGFRLEMPLPAHLVYAGSLAAVPMVSFGLAGVNNDVLAWFAGGLVILGTCRWTEDRRGRRTALLLGAGVGIALLAKLTAALLCIVAVLLVILRSIVIERPRRLRKFAAPMFLIAVCSLPGVIYHAAQLAKYGTPFPRGAASSVEESVTAVPETPPNRERKRLSPAQWAKEFASTMVGTWVNIVGHKFTDRQSPLEAIGLLLLPILAAVGFFAKSNPRDPTFSTILPALRSAAVACAIVMAAHFLYTYRAHMLTNFIGGVAARYYFPMLPALLLLASRPFAVFGRNRRSLFIALILVALLGYANLAAFFEVARDPAWHTAMQPPGH
jgi:hypothetical protein